MNTQTDGTTTTDIQASPHVHKAEELHCDGESNEGREEEESPHLMEQQPDDELLTSIGMYDYAGKGEGPLEKEIRKSGDVVTEDMYEDPECEDSADP